MSSTNPLKVVMLGCVALVIVVALLFGLGAAFKSYNRYQKRADANNQTAINAIRIKQTEQLVKVAQQEARIRFEKALGIKNSQHEVAKTLTPLFVQYEMITALDHIASSGKNNTVVYIPAGANGVPLVSVSDKPQVFGGEDQEGE